MSSHPQGKAVRLKYARLLLIIAIGLLSVGLVVQPGWAQALGEPVIAKLKDAVVLVEVTLALEDGNAEASGSGFLISDQGHIITNAHVVAQTTEGEDGRTLVAKGREVNVVFHPGTNQERSVPAQVLRENHDLDLAELKIEADTPVYLDLADSDAAKETSRIYVCGHPLGLREISIRTGTVTAHRTWDEHSYIEHDASAEEGNSGGPVVDSDGRVIGVHTMTLISKGMLTKFAIPSNVVRAWLATDPSEDPPPPLPGKIVRDLLDGTDLNYEEVDTGIFSLPFEGDVTVLTHEYDDFLRVFVDLGEMPGDTKLLQGLCALEALRFNYTDPVGRLSVTGNEGAYSLYWECQTPISAASPEYLGMLIRTGANQAQRWQQLMNAENPPEPTDLYPGGDDDALTPKLEQHIKTAGLTYEAKEGYFLIPYDNDVNVVSRIFQGMALTQAYTGGMPGETTAGQAVAAIELLKRNWDDPLGRLSLDEDNDVVWESQVPFDFLTSDYLAIVSSTCANQVADFWEQYGKVAFNGE